MSDRERIARELREVQDRLAKNLNLVNGGGDVARLIDIAYELLALTRGSELLLYCHADRDGDCAWEHCIQKRDGEPKRTKRHCPLDQHEPDGTYHRDIVTPTEEPETYTREQVNQLVQATVVDALAAHPTEEPSAVEAAAFQVAYDAAELVGENDQLTEALREIADAEQYRMYQACPDCDNPRICDPEKKCRAESMSEKIARRALSHSTGEN
ncbi:hypothetical protein LCGC14_1636130 [marine sediment metagenome]|uniref:Uncharacterized protein n=1 Tax=marine sediment metagenome TaxID=412755 RepID=A0A0F9KGS5_9ZZZZ